MGSFAEGYDELAIEYSGKARAFLEAKGATEIRRQLVERILYGKPRPRLVPLRDKTFSEFQMLLAKYAEF